MIKPVRLLRSHKEQEVQAPYGSKGGSTHEAATHPASTATVMILVTKQQRFARWLALPSLVTTLAFAMFLLVPHYLYENPLQAYVLGPPGPARPIFWLPSLLEWLVFGAVAL